MTPRLVAAMAGLVALVAVALAIPLSAIVDSDEREMFIARLEIDALSTASLLASQPTSAWESIALSAAERTGARVVVVDGDRRLIADSDLTDLDRSFDRAEIDQALDGFLASDVRFSQTLGLNLRYVAAPVVQDEQIVAAVRLSLPNSVVDDVVNRTRLALALFVAAVVVAAALLAWVLAYSIATPLRRVADVADDLSDDLQVRADEGSGPREVRSVARALNRTAGRLAGLLQRQERVAEDASHHLRTPLTGVRLRLEAIEDTAQQEAVQREATAAIAEVDRLTRRIEQVLALARSDAGSDIVRVDLLEIVQDRVASASARAKVEGIRFDLDVASGVDRVMAGEGAIARVIDEMIGNALNYARSMIRVTVQQVDARVQMCVDDDGPGVNESECESIFERFTRGSQSIPGGSGLGLALVRETARSSGGDAWAQRSDLGGLRVCTTWPVTSSSTG